MKNIGFTKKSKFGIGWVNKIEPFWVKWPKTPEISEVHPFLPFILNQHKICCLMVCDMNIFGKLQFSSIFRVQGDLGKYPLFVRSKISKSSRFGGWHQLGP